MKKTFSLSISGRIFQVEEDAYALLLDYLESLSQIFRKSEASEIVDDIEARISDLFQEKADAGKLVFTIADAQSVIATIGNAEEIAAESDEHSYEEAVNGNEETEGAETRQDRGTPPPPPVIEIKRKLYRSMSDKVIGGVLGGLAIKFGINVLALRIIMVLLLFPLDFFPVFLAYCVAWAIIPKADTPERILEQQGRTVTVANVGSVLSSQASHTPAESNAESFIRVLGTLILGFMGLIAGAVGLALLVAIFVIIAYMIAGAANPEILSYFTPPFGVDLTAGDKYLAMTFAISVCIAMLLPCIALVWAACTSLFKVKGASRHVWIVALVIEAIAIALPIILSPLIAYAR